ncbi:hypothetical protein A4S05_00190 [Nostoc sp. KVJ20]|nr:hypothetical protein A4S05_00190 [Nostoc sp. KVJ20]
MFFIKIATFLINIAMFFTKIKAFLINIATFLINIATFLTNIAIFLINIATFLINIKAIVKKNRYRLKIKKNYSSLVVFFNKYNYSLILLNQKTALVRQSSFISIFKEYIYVS